MMEWNLDWPRVPYLGTMMVKWRADGLDFGLEGCLVKTKASQMDLRLGYHWANLTDPLTVTLMGVDLVPSLVMLKGRYSAWTKAFRMDLNSEHYWVNLTERLMATLMGVDSVPSLVMMKVRYLANSKA